ncbi:MAG TPA: ABC transporter ATP-binding protein, partial [Ruminococcaceae bacterium]|nr:ABC transporter ATP-binding protein [Oscillospiraceae bacterium]
MKGAIILLEFQDVKWQLQSGEPIIKGISCKLDSRLTVITGPNGGGK